MRLRVICVLYATLLMGCTQDQGSSNARKYPDTVKGVAEAMNDAANTAIKEEEAKRHPVQEDVKTPEYYNKLGTELVNAERYEEAIDNFNLACQQGNSEGCEKYAITMQYYKQHAPWIRKKREQEQKRKVDEALSKDPKNTDAIREQAMVYALDKQYKSALRLYVKAIAINPNESESFLGRGYVYSSMRQYDDAIADYDKAIMLNPNSVQAYTNRGVAYAQMGDVRRGISDLQTACNMGDSRACGVISSLVRN